MNRILLFSAIAICLVARCTNGQYQTAPAYGMQQQQRKMVPNPQAYGMQQQQRDQSSYGGNRMMGKPNKMSMDSYDQQSQASMGDEQGGYGKQMGAGKQSGGYDGNSQQSTADSYGSKGSMGAKYEEPQHPPMPFAWGYDINDGYGATQFHKENGDENGKRTGSYGYKDAYGVYRHVNYIADENGFRATIKTNEPGTANENPADVEIMMEEPPANVFEGNKNSGYGNSNGASSSYGSMSSSGDSSQMGQQYGSTGSGGNQDMSTASGKQYASSANSMNAEPTGQQQYGSGSASSMLANMMNADIGRQYNSGGTSSMASPMSMNGGSGKQYGGSSMMGNSMGNQYGMSMSGSEGGAMSEDRYGMNAGDGQADSKSTYGKSMSAGSGASRYGGASSMMPVAGQAKARRYSQAMAKAAKQYSMNSAATANDQANDYSSQSAAMLMGSGMEGAQYGAPSMSSAMRETTKGGQMQQQYGGAANQADDLSAQQYGAGPAFNADSMLAQQYGPMMGNSNNAQQMQSMYGSPATGGMGSMSLMDGSSTYSSTRIQSKGNNKQSGYGGNASSQRNDPYNKSSQQQMGNMSNGMDYRKAATKSIAALAKRY